MKIGDETHREFDVVAMTMGVQAQKRVKVRKIKQDDAAGIANGSIGKGALENMTNKVMN